MSTRKEIGERIASARGFRRMSQGDLGAFVGVTKQTISSWETGYRAPDPQLKELAPFCTV